MAVHGECHVPRAGDAFQNSRHHAAHFAWRGVADGVGEVHRRRAGGDGGRNGAAEEGNLRAGGVLRAELHVRAERLRVGDGFGDARQRRLARDVELVLEMDVARREEDMDARTGGALDRRGGRRHVAFRRAGERHDTCLRQTLRHGADRLRVALGGRGESGFDEVDAERLKLEGEADLFSRVHAVPGRLFAVAERCVEDADHEETTPSPSSRRSRTRPP